MTDHSTGTRAQWLAARQELLAREKEHTRLGDELARRRRELPWVRVEQEYRFDTEDGPRTLAELFDGRGQLLVYHFMFGPGYQGGCPSCSSTADSFNGVLSHLKARDVTMICVSRAPVDKLCAYRKRMGWDFTWASSHDSDFNVDFGVSAGEPTGPGPAGPGLEPTGGASPCPGSPCARPTICLRRPRCSSSAASSPPSRSYWTARGLRPRAPCVSGSRDHRAGWRSLAEPAASR